MQLQQRVGSRHVWHVAASDPLLRRCPSRWQHCCAGAPTSWCTRRRRHPRCAGILYAASLWLSNSAYLYLSVSFIQMTKSLMPGLVYSSGVVMKTEKWQTSSALNMLLIAFGVVVCAVGEANLVLKGLVQQLAALLFEVRRGRGEGAITARDSHAGYIHGDELGSTPWRFWGGWGAWGGGGAWVLGPSGEASQVVKASCRSWQGSSWRWEGSRS